MSEPKYTDQQIKDAIERMSLGVSFQEACAEQGINNEAARQRIVKDPEMAGLYARARESFADVMAEQLNEIVDKEEDHQRARLKCDNIKWYAAKVLPKKYGDRQVIAGDENAPIKHDVALSGLPDEMLRSIRDAARTLADKQAAGS